jgi:hypothetical protein
LLLLQEYRNKSSERREAERILLEDAGQRSRMGTCDCEPECEWDGEFVVFGSEQLVFSA